MNVVFDTGHADIENKKSDRIIPAAVHQHQPASLCQYPVHFPNGLVLVGIVMERITARHNIKGIVLKRQIFRITQGKADFGTQVPFFRFFAGLADHIFRHVQAHDRFYLRQGVEIPHRQRAGPAADIEYPDFLQAPPNPVPKQGLYPSVAGFEKEDVNDIAVIMLRPAVKMRIGRLFPYMILACIGNFHRQYYTDFRHQIKQAKTFIIGPTLLFSGKKNAASVFVLENPVQITEVLQ